MYSLLDIIEHGKQFASFFVFYMTHFEWQKKKCVTKNYKSILN